LAEDIRYYGQWMRDEAEKRIGHLYPKVAVIQERDGKFRHVTPAEITIQKSAIQHLTVIAWLWARTVASPNPAAKGAHVPLVRSFWLSTKAGNKAWIEPVVERSTMTYGFEVRTGQGEPRAGTVNRNGGVCLLTGSPMPLDYVRAEGKAGRLGARLMAIVAEGTGGRIYLPPNPEHERTAQSAEPNNVPDTNLPEQALGFRVQNYGMTKHRHLFTNRQLVALTTFCDLVGEARTRVLRDAASAGWLGTPASQPAGDAPPRAGTDAGAPGPQAYADAVATYLAMWLGRFTDLNNALCQWRSDPAKQHVGHLFARQAISMVWDYAEASLAGDN